MYIRQMLLGGYVRIQTGNNNNKLFQKNVACGNVRGGKRYRIWIEVRA